VPGVISEYPWSNVPQLSGDEVVAAREAHFRLAQYFDADHFAQIARELCGLELEGFGTTGGAYDAGGAPSLGADVQLTAPALELRVSFEPAFVTRVLNHLLGRQTGVTHDGPLAAPLLAAFHAVCGEVCRRSAPAAPAAVAGAHPMSAPAPSEAWRVDFWVRLDGVAYRGRLLVGLRGGPVPDGVGARAVAAPGGRVPVSLPVVLMQHSLLPAELGSLEAGDAVVFDAEWGPLRGAAWLCGGNSEAALGVEVVEQGLVLRGAAVLGYEVMTMSKTEATTAQGLEAAVLEAPVVVRLELGEVTLSAREWLALRAGDVLQTDVPLGESVALRVAGRVVARGTLVNVEGKLGVRVLSVLPS
jgi:flagellar motor switch/type III secretory pathway protein FliN